jgi:hypothetical protein
MTPRRTVSLGIFTAIALAAGLASGPASAWTQNVHPIPFDGKTGGPSSPGGPGDHLHSPGVSCFVVGASCNKGPMPPWMNNGGRWDNGYPGYPRGNGNPSQPGWPKHGNAMNVPY